MGVYSISSVIIIAAAIHHHEFAVYIAGDGYYINFIIKHDHEINKNPLILNLIIHIVFFENKNELK